MIQFSWYASKMGTFDFFIFLIIAFGDLQELKVVFDLELPWRMNPSPMKANKMSAF